MLLLFVLHVISHAERTVLLHQYFPQFVCSAQYGFFFFLRFLNFVLFPICCSGIIYLSIWCELPGIHTARGRCCDVLGYFKEAAAKLMRGAVRLCLYSESWASLSRIGQSAPGGLLYQGPPSKLRGTTKNLCSVVEQLLITHRIRYTRCLGKLPSGYSLCRRWAHQHFLTQGLPVIRSGTVLVAVIANYVALMRSADT